MKRLFTFLGLLAAVCCSAREWTSSDGRKIDAEFVSAAGGNVTLKRADGQSVTFPLTRLSAEDQAWVTEQGAAAKPAASAAGASAGGGKPITGAFAELVTGDWALSEYKGIPFALYASKELSAGKSYPLVLMLHGKSPNNENGKQVGGWMKSFAKPERYAKDPCILVAPLCYQPFGATGAGWYDKPGDQAIALVKELIKSLPVDKARVYCIGHSMGGSGTCHVMNKEPKLFAAGVPVSGVTGPETAAAFKKAPIWIFQAADDKTVPPTYARDLSKALSHSKECKSTEYPDGGHGIPGKVFDDPEVIAWLFSKGAKKG